jgi:hypothetical protein
VDHHLGHSYASGGFGGVGGVDVVVKWRELPRSVPQPVG